MQIDVKLIKQLREITGAGVLDCKQALQEAQGDTQKACEILRKMGYEKAQEYINKETKVGRIASYVHNGRIGAMVELSCETDFVAMNEEFNDLLHDLCLQVVGADPVSISVDDLPKDLVEKEKSKYEAELEEKPPEIKEKILEGALEKNLYSQKCLLKQLFINEAKFNGTVEELIKSKIAKLGENITIRRFVRFELGKIARTCEDRSEKKV